MSKYHVIATPTTEDGFGENVFLGTCDSQKEAIEICTRAGFTVLIKGVEIQKYDAEDAPFIFSFEADGMGAISIPVKP